MGIPALHPALAPALDALADRVEMVRFDLPTPSQPTDREAAANLAYSIREYLLPRIADLEAPVLAVIVGSTGSGKSTLLNSLAGKLVSPVGVLRPTTQAPVLWCHQRHADRYRDHVAGHYGESGRRPLVVVPDDDSLLEHLTLVDAPDFDSVALEHRTMAGELLAAADLCIFVASAQRYADAAPWEFLGRMRRRDQPAIFVLNRVTRRSATVAADYLRLLVDGGVLDDPDPGGLIVVEEQQVDPSSGALAARSVATLRARLEGVADNSERRRLLERSVHGAVQQAVADTLELAGRVSAEAAMGDRLIDAAGSSYRLQAEALRASLAHGTLIRAEVVARWEEFVGTGDLAKVVASSAGRLRDWARRVFGGRPVAQQLGAEAGDEIVATVERAADAAARSAAAAWEADATGRVLLGEVPDGGLWRHDPGTSPRAHLAVADWMGEVVKLVREQGETRRRTAKAASYGVNALAVVLLLSVFVHTGGLTGAEAGIAAGAAAAQQKVLEHVFGAAAARSLVEDAQRRLGRALDTVLSADEERFSRLVDGRRSKEGTSSQLRAAAEVVRVTVRSEEPK